MGKEKKKLKKGVEKKNKKGNKKTIFLSAVVDGTTCKSSKVVSYISSIDLEDQVLFVPRPSFLLPYPFLFPKKPIYY
jgi:hypothetical protein